MANLGDVASKTKAVLQDLPEVVAKDIRDTVFKMSAGIIRPLHPVRIAKSIGTQTATSLALGGPIDFFGRIINELRRSQVRTDKDTKSSKKIEKNTEKGAEAAEGSKDVLNKLLDVSTVTRDELVKLTEWFLKNSRPRSTTSVNDIENSRERPDIDAWEKFVVEKQGPVDARSTNGKGLWDTIAAGIAGGLGGGVLSQILGKSVGMISGALLGSFGMLASGLGSVFSLIFKPVNLLRVIGRFAIPAMVIGSLATGITAGFEEYFKSGSLKDALVKTLDGIGSFITLGMVNNFGDAWDEMTKRFWDQFNSRADQFVKDGYTLNLPLDRFPGAPPKEVPPPDPTQSWPPFKVIGKEDFFKQNSVFDRAIEDYKSYNRTIRAIPTLAERTAYQRKMLEFIASKWHVDMKQLIQKINVASTKDREIVPVVFRLGEQIGQGAQANGSSGLVIEGNLQSPNVIKPDVTYKRLVGVDVTPPMDSLLWTPSSHDPKVVYGPAGDQLQAAPTQRGLYQNMISNPPVQPAPQPPPIILNDNSVHNNSQPNNHGVYRHEESTSSPRYKTLWEEWAGM